jgi:hypothetical protein
MTSSRDNSGATLTRYSSAGETALEGLRMRLDPQMYELQPSVVRLWYNADERAAFQVIDGYAVGWLQAHAESPRWILCSHRPLDTEEFHRAAELATTHDPSATEFHHATETVASRLLDAPASSLHISCEPDSEWHYTYEVDQQVACVGRAFSGTRRHKRRFLRLPGSMEVETAVYSRDPFEATRLTLDEALAFHDRWYAARNEVDAWMPLEKEALTRLLCDPEPQHFGPRLLVTVRQDGLLVGLSIYERIGEAWALSHYQKADLRFPGASYYLWWQMACLLQAEGVTHFNFMEDMGHPGLRVFKRRMRPLDHCRQYVIGFA